MSINTRISKVSIARVASVAALSLMLTGAFAACGKTPSSGQVNVAVPAVAKASTHINLTIEAKKPGSTVDGPSYMPDTALTVPANSLVTVTIVNNDAGDTSLPANSPFAKVTGVESGSAYVDGVAYNSLTVDKVAHTFTIPSLGVNVPIPGDVPAGQKDISVTFSFRTGAAGVYMWQCMDPCGSDPVGWGGPMSMKGYMMGSLTVTA